MNTERKTPGHRSCQPSNQSVENNSFFSKTNCLPWILGEIGLISIIGIVVYFVLKNKKVGEE